MSLLKSYTISCTGVSDTFGESLRHFPNLSEYNQLDRWPLEDQYQVCFHSRPPATELLVLWSVGSACFMPGLKD